MTNVDHQMKVLVNHDTAKKQIGRDWRSQTNSIDQLSIDQLSINLSQNLLSSDGRSQSSQETSGSVRNF